MELVSWVLLHAASPHTRLLAALHGGQDWFFLNWLSNLVFKLDRVSSTCSLTKRSSLLLPLLLIIVGEHLYVGTDFMMALLIDKVNKFTTYCIIRTLCLGGQLIFGAGLNEIILSLAVVSVRIWLLIIFPNWYLISEMRLLVLLDELSIYLWIMD